MPKCCRCLLDKDETEFYRTFYHCKACCKLDYARKREAKHAYYERNKEHITQRTKAYRKRWNQTDNGREANKRNGHLWRARKFNNGRVEPITLTEAYVEYVSQIVMQVTLQSTTSYHCLNMARILGTMFN